MTDVLSNPYGQMMAPAPEDIVELSLLLPAAQASELEAAAFQRGLTAGEMVRRLVRDFLSAQKAKNAETPALFRNLNRSTTDR